MKRREFIEGVALSVALVPAGASLLAGCGDDGGASDPDAGPVIDGGGCGDGNATGMSDFHSHTVTLTPAQIDAGAMIVVPAVGGGHPHDVPFTPSDLAALESGCTVTVTSTDSDHDHDWIVNVV